MAPWWKIATGCWPPFGGGVRRPGRVVSATERLSLNRARPGYLNGVVEECLTKSAHTAPGVSRRN